MSDSDLNLGDLIAEARAVADLLEGMANRARIRRLADALESTAARLREAKKERDEFADALVQTGEDCDAVKERLREAEAVIENALGYIDHHWLAPFRQGENGHGLRAILATYRQTTNHGGSER